MLIKVIIIVLHFRCCFSIYKSLIIFKKFVFT